MRRGHLPGCLASGRRRSPSMTRTGARGTSISGSPKRRRVHSTHEGSPSASRASTASRRASSSQRSPRWSTTRQRGPRRDLLGRPASHEGWTATRLRQRAHGDCALCTPRPEPDFLPRPVAPATSRGTREAHAGTTEGQRGRKVLQFPGRPSGLEPLTPGATVREGAPSGARGPSRLLITLGDYLGRRATGRPRLMSSAPEGARPPSISPSVGFAVMTAPAALEYAKRAGEDY